MFEVVNDLVKAGGRFDGYQPIFQGGNAGLYEYTQCKKGVEEFCEQEGWKWIPQRSQMPHVNMCDLSVFPNMSNRHIQLTRDQGTHVLTEE